jgi:hypothetical protein
MNDLLSEQRSSSVQEADPIRDHVSGILAVILELIVS